jgi:hypothetical protein
MSTLFNSQRQTLSASDHSVPGQRDLLPFSSHVTMEMTLNQMSTNEAEIIDAAFVQSIVPKIVRPSGSYNLIAICLWLLYFDYDVSSCESLILLLGVHLAS